MHGADNGKIWEKPAQPPTDLENLENLEIWKNEFSKEEYKYRKMFKKIQVINFGKKKNSKINDHDSWLLILHNKTKELFEKNIKKYDLESKNINIKCINKTYNIEIIRV